MDSQKLWQVKNGKTDNERDEIDILNADGRIADRVCSDNVPRILNFVNFSSTRISEYLYFLRQISGFLRVIHRAGIKINLFNRLQNDVTVAIVAFVFWILDAAICPFRFTVMSGVALRLKLSVRPSGAVLQNRRKTSHGAV